MNNVKKKGLAALLALCLMLSLIPYYAFAQETQDELVIGIPGEGKYGYEEIKNNTSLKDLEINLQSHKQLNIQDNIEFNLEFKKIGSNSFEQLGTKKFNDSIEFHAGTYKITAKGIANTPYHNKTSQPAEFEIVPWELKAKLASGINITKEYDGTTGITLLNNSIPLTFDDGIFNNTTNLLHNVYIINATYKTRDVGNDIEIIGGELKFSTLKDYEDFKVLRPDILKGAITPKNLTENDIDFSNLSFSKVFDRTRNSANTIMSGSVQVNGQNIDLTISSKGEFNDFNAGDYEIDVTFSGVNNNNNYTIKTPITKKVNAKITKANLSFNENLPEYRIKEGQELPNEIAEYFKTHMPLDLEHKGVKVNLTYSQTKSSQATDYSPAADWVKNLPAGQHKLYVKLSPTEEPYYKNYNDLILPKPIVLLVGDQAQDNQNNQNQNSGGSSDNTGNSGGGSTDGGSTGGGSTGGGTTGGGGAADVAPKAKDETKNQTNVKTENQTSTAKVEAEVKKADKKVEAKLQDKAIEEAVKALDKEVKAKKTQPQLEIKLDTAKNTEEIKLELSKKAVETLVNNKVEALNIESDFGSLSLDKKALESAAKQVESKSLTLNIAKAEEKLNEKQKEVVGDKPVYDITLLDGDKKVKNFDGGMLTIELPYELKAGEVANRIAIWYVDDMGNIEKMDAMYSVKTKSVIFTTTHLSKYVIVHENWMNAFKDVKDTDWFYAAVKYIAERDLMKGVKDDMFGPEEMTTRAMFVTILHRMEGRPAAAEMASFKDVEAGKYYADAVNWASANGIVKGVGNELFAPNMEITREQAALILKNYADFKKMEVKADSDLAKFEDRDEISPWATDALKWAVNSNIIKGKSETMLAPQANATRAELSQILMNFMELSK